MVDGVPGPGYDRIAPAPAISRDGSVVAYAARRGTDQFCVVNDEAGPPFRQVTSPRITPDGRHIAYVADESRVVLDGRPGPSFPWMGELVLSPEGAVACTARDAAGQATIVVDGNAGRPFDYVTPPVFSERGNVVAYGGLRRGRWFLVVGEHEQEVEGAIRRAFLSPDGTRVSCILEENGGRVRLLGNPQAFDWIGWERFTSSGRIVWFARVGGRTWYQEGEHATDLGECTVWNPELDDAERTITFDLLRGRDLYRMTLSAR